MAERKQVKGPAWNPSLCQVRAGCLLTTDTGLLWSFLYHRWEGKPERQDLFPVTQCQLIEFGFSPLAGGTPVISPHAPVSPHVKEFPTCNCPAEVLEQQQQHKNTRPIAWDWQFSGSGKRWYKKIEDMCLWAVLWTLTLNYFWSNQNNKSCCCLSAFKYCFWMTFIY